MKKAIALLILFPLVFMANAQKPAHKKAPEHAVTQAPPKALEMLKFFYTAYMESFIGEGDMRIASSRQSLLRRTYCTKRCLARYDVLLDKTGVDPIIKAIDSNFDALKSLEITKDTDPKYPNNYTVSYAAGDIKVEIKLSLVTENEEIKIDYLD